jgi:hypothetical protein
MTCLLKAGIAEPEETSIPRLQQPKQPAIAKQLLCKHVNVVTEVDETVEEFMEKNHVTIENLLEAVFSMRSNQRLYSGRHLPLKIAAPATQGSPDHWKFSKVYTGPRFAHGFQPSVCIRLYNKTVQATSRSHTKSRERTCSQYWTRRTQT